MLTIAVVNLKGGTAKTTTTAFMLHALAESDLQVIGVDADPENQSLVAWSSVGEWDVPVVGLAVDNLHRKLAGIVPEGSYDAVVIDTPPVKDRTGIVMSALRLATHVVIPMAPTPMEYDQLGKVRDLVADAAAARSDGQEPEVQVLLTRTAAGAASTEAYREVITEDGCTVLPGEIRRKELFAQAHGRPVRNAVRTAYGDAVAALIGAGA